MGQKLKRFGLTLIRQKYLWTILVFIAVVGFLDPNSICHLYQLRQQNQALRDEIAVSVQKYNVDTEALNDLLNSPEAVERVARVNLYMRTPDEDVYVIEP